MSRKEIIGVVALGVLFIIGALLSQNFSAEIIARLDFGYAGMFAYILVCVVATVIAPISTVPLIPIATVLWGPFITALLSVFGWTVGALIAFLIARRFGRPLVARFVDLEKIRRYERALEGKYIFWNIVFLRMVVPVDVLSYAIGLFTQVELLPYTLATFIGAIPFAFVFSYASEATLFYQILSGVLVLIAVYLGFRKMKQVRE